MFKKLLKRLVAWRARMRAEDEETERALAVYAKWADLI